MVKEYNAPSDQPQKQEEASHTSRQSDQHIDPEAKTTASSANVRQYERPQNTEFNPRLLIVGALVIILVLALVFLLF